MTRFPIFIFLLFIFAASAQASGVPSPEQMAARDASAKESCLIVPEVIVPLRPPEFAGVQQWKRTFGVEGLDRAEVILPLADGGFFVVGESRPLSGPDKKPESLQLYLIRLDGAGKAIFEKRHKIEGLERVIAATLSKDRLYVLTEQKKENRTHARISSFDGKGDVQKFARDLTSARDVFPQDMVILGDQILVALWEKNHKNPDDNLTVLKRLSFDGKILSEREYLPGVPNRVRSLTRISSGGVLAVGDIIRENGATAGWIMRLDSRDGIVWQRPYSRGAGAQLNRGAVLKSGDGFAVSGSSIPADGKPRAAWVMTVSPQGEPVWQNYMTGSYDYSAEDIITMEDGRVSVLMNGAPDSKGGRAHARIATFDAQGKQVNDESYIEGANAHALRFVTLDKARVITGAAQTGFAGENADVLTRESTFDAWVAALPLLQDFQDPCQVKEAAKPNDKDEKRVP